MFENIKEAFQRCEDCGRSLLIGTNRFPHPLKPGKLLCDNCTGKYDEYRRKKYFEALDEAMTNVIDSFYNYSMDGIKDE